jgi:iron complex transport system ATP-binding protein
MGILRVEQLDAGYGKTMILNDINLTVAAAKITSIIGPNGCGKSTLLKTMGRITPQWRGKVYLHGKDLSRLPTLQIARHLALLPQHPLAPPELKGEELVAFGRFPHHKKLSRLSAQDKEAIAWAMELTQVTSLRGRPIGSLSGGERQRIWLAMALAQETEILLMDEPTTYLDIAQQLEMLKIVRRLNQERHCTVLMVLHDINHAARFSDEIVAMKQGKIIATGPPPMTITQEVLQSVFQIEARVLKDPLGGAPVCFGY